MLSPFLICLTKISGDHHVSDEWDDSIKKRRVIFLVNFQTYRSKYDQSLCSRGRCDGTLYTCLFDLI